MSGIFMKLFRDLERRIAADTVSPEDIVEAEHADPSFRKMRKLTRDDYGFRKIIRQQREDES